MIPDATVTQVGVVHTSACSMKRQLEVSIMIPIYPSFILVPLPPDLYPACNDLHWTLCQVWEQPWALDERQSA
jgi:hypothetical protein